MNVYLLVDSDRHIDIEFKVYLDGDKAVAKAKEMAVEYCRHLEDFEENDCSNSKNVLYSATYSCEGDNIYVEKVEVEA